MRLLRRGRSTGSLKSTPESRVTQEALGQAWAFNHDEIVELVER
jgi:hypothetical protein